MDIAGLIQSFKTGTYSVSRRAALPPVRGRGQEAAASTLPIVASIQPAGGRDLQRLDVGRRALETRVLFTITPLFVGGQGEAYEADRLTIGGKVWEVQHVEEWSDPGSTGKGYRCIIQAAS